VAELVAGGDPSQPEDVTAVAPIVSAGEIQGAVLLLGPGGPAADDYLSAAAVASLTGIAMLNARDDTARSLDSSLLGELLAGRKIRAGDVLRRAKLLGSDLSDGAVALCIDPLGRQPGRLVAMVLSERPDALAEKVGTRVFALLPGDVEAARRTVDRLTGKAVVGVSAHYRQAGDARLALAEAELLLDVAAAGGPERGESSASASFRLLFRLFASHPEEIRRFSDSTIGAIVRHDEQNGTELVATLRAYQEQNCNMNLTAKAIYTHRHTVSNRLARVQELTGLDPFQNEDRELLGLALKAGRIVELRPAH
jgi:sugar diacid utilization regulator